MVTKGGKEGRPSTPPDGMPLKPSCPSLSIDELERRLEMAALHGGWHAREQTHGAIDMDGEDCGCLGVLCHCDGQDCVGVCEAHCIINYL
jgi:hypothetical protein